MEKKIKISNALKDKIDNLAEAALKAGKGNRVYGGGTSGIALGDEYTLKGITYTEQHMKPDDIDQDDWDNLKEDERKEKGVLRGWFSFVTNNGNLAFSAVMGEKGQNTAAYWEDVPAEQKAENFDPTKVWMPSCRTAETWVENDCDNLIGKTIKCVATKQYRPERSRFDVKVRAWTVMN